MSRNRYKHTHTLQWAVILKCLLVIGTFAAMGMSYVLMKNRNLRLAEQVSVLDVEHQNLKRRNDQLLMSINRLTSHAMLQQRVNELGLGLVEVGELNTVAMDRGSIGTRYLEHPQSLSNEQIVPVLYNVSARQERHP